MQDLDKIIKLELKDIRNDIRDLKQEITKYKGFVGGVLWTGAALLAAFQLVYKWISGPHL
mgnify:CR=1 FL=1|tara:strand:- start:160149 stop:160328 length:180 start_codon:yes stop_codon:yes gene_type:complete